MRATLYPHVQLVIPWLDDFDMVHFLFTFYLSTLKLMLIDQRTDFDPSRDVLHYLAIIVSNAIL